MTHLVVFDVDGTLVDSQNMIVEAQRRTFEAHGLPVPDRTRALSIVGLSLPEAFIALAGQDAPVAALVNTYKQMFQELRHDPAFAEPLYPGVAMVLESLAARPDITLAIATGKSRRGVDHMLARHGFTDMFASIQTADDAPSKPHPGMLLQAMRATGAMPDATVMVGDSTFDMLMSRAAAVRAIGVSWGYHAPALLREAGAATILEQISALPALLAGHATVGDDAAEGMAQGGL
ncbi:MAG: HAD-IA family hydrolase [Salinarimonas sp.]|nr:HAD-IA family hydrolase [Salinarimonas sp.]